MAADGLASSYSSRATGRLGVIVDTLLARGHTARAMTREAVSAAAQRASSPCTSPAFSAPVPIEPARRQP
jgi:hypothetical protein